MKVLTFLLLAAGVAGFAGCESSPVSESPADMPNVAETDIEPSLEPIVPLVEEPADLSVSGELAEIDPELSMLQLVFDDGTRTTFQYTEQTEVVGTGGVQGLSAREGTRATIEYDDGTMPPTAISIEVAPTEEPQPAQPQL